MLSKSKISMKMEIVGEDLSFYLSIENCGNFGLVKYYGICFLNVMFDNIDFSRLCLLDEIDHY